MARDSLAAATVTVVTLRSREHSYIGGVFEEEGVSDVDREHPAIAPWNSADD
jgi:hypothetical protein